MKDEVDKVVDLVTWLDQRIEQRIAQEREHWRSLLVDVIAEERARVGVLVAEVTKTTHGIPDQVKQIVEQSGKTIVEGINRIFDQFETRRDPMRHPDDDGEVPPSKH